MGNCQAAEAATVVIQHPGGSKVERFYWSVSANEVMNSNPGHYVAMLVAAPATTAAANGTPVRQLKLLRPDDTLVLGHVYRLVSFEDVLKEFAAKKCAKLGKLLERGALKIEQRKTEESKSRSVSSTAAAASSESEVDHRRVGNSQSGVVARHTVGGQWRPALKSISELGT